MGACVFGMRGGGCISFMEVLGGYGGGKKSVEGDKPWIMNTAQVWGCKRLCSLFVL